MPRHMYTRCEACYINMARKTLKKAAIRSLERDLSANLGEHELVEFVVRKLQESPQFKTGQYLDRKHFLQHVTSTDI